MRAPSLDNHPDLAVALADIVRSKPSTTSHLSLIELAQTIGCMVAASAAFFALGPIMLLCWGSIS